MSVGVEITQVICMCVYTALALFTRSPCAFEAVKILNILHLPSRSSLQSFTSANIQRPGVSREYICEQWKAYSPPCEHLSGPKPVREGVLIFDEVKVQNGVRYVHVVNITPYIVFHSVQLNLTTINDDVIAFTCVCMYMYTCRFVVIPKLTGIVGLGMTPDELATLADVYEKPNEDGPMKTTYVLEGHIVRLRPHRAIFH